MPSLPSATPLSSLSLLRLPPAIRVSLYQNASRPFSASASRKEPLYDLAVAGPLVIINGIHSLGIPWYATFPLAALLVRGVLGYHLATLPNRKAAITRTNLVPLVHVNSKVQYNEYKRNVFAHSKLKNIKAFQPLITLRLEAMRVYLTLKGSHTVGKAFRVPVWSWRVFFNLGQLLAFTEAIRVVCGAPKGLIGTFTASVVNALPYLGEEHGMPRIEAVKNLEERGQNVKKKPTPITEHAQEELGLPVGNADTVGESNNVSSLDSPELLTAIDSSIKTEGLAWCQDLTVADPTLILPVTFCVGMALHILVRPKRTTGEKTDGERKIGQIHQSTRLNAQAKTDVGKAIAEAHRLDLAFVKPRSSLVDNLTTTDRILLSISLLAFFIVLKLPAGMLLYMVPNVLVGWMQRRWLDIRYPIPEPIRPCRIPLRVKVRKEVGKV